MDVTISEYSDYNNPGAKNDYEGGDIEDEWGDDDDGDDDDDFGNNY